MISAACVSCQYLQAGHWKSLAMTSQTVAFGLPMIRFVSANVIRGSTDMSEVAEAPGATAAASPFATSGPLQAPRDTARRTAMPRTSELRVISKHPLNRYVIL